MPTLTDEPLIHHYIFAGPKPGLSAEAFQSYWVTLHAVDFADKIPRIKRYLVATREADSVVAMRQHASDMLAADPAMPFADNTCVFSMVAREHWIAGRPGARP